MPLEFGDYPIDVGRIVIWTSHANGNAKHKHGKVLVIVPAGKSAADVHIPDVGRYRKVNIDNSGMARDHESYIVAVEHSGHGKPSLYWPRVSALRVV